MENDLILSKETVRKFAIKVLDDGHGINEEAMDLLSTILVETGNEDFLGFIEIVDGRCYIGEDVAEEELNKLL